jgi:hypothetical protein
MPSNRRLIGILIILLGLIIILAIIYFGFWRQTATPTPTGPGNQGTTTSQLPSGGEPTNATTTPGDKPRNPQQYDIAKEPAHKFNATDLEKLAMAFSERLGSYSSQSDYGNLTDLKIYMTESLKTWAIKYADQLRTARGNASYYGISTVAVYATVKSFDDQAGQAAVTVTTERRESTEKIGGGIPFRQDINLNFKKVNDEWLVDSAYWVK